MPDINRLKIVASQSNLRSKLARWLSANRDEFAAMLKDYRPRWEPMVEWFSDEGLVELPPEFFSDDESMREMTRRKMVRAAMRTWERVKAANGVAVLQEKPSEKPASSGRGSLRDRMKPVRVVRDG